MVALMRGLMELLGGEHSVAKATAMKVIGVFRWWSFAGFQRRRKDVSRLGRKRGDQAQMIPQQSSLTATHSLLPPSLTVCACGALDLCPVLFASGL